MHCREVHAVRCHELPLALGQSKAKRCVAFPIRLSLRALNDTSPSALRRYDELLRQQTPAQRLAIAMSLSRAVRELAIAGIRSARPNASPREVQEELAVRMYGREVAKRLFGPRVV